MDIRRSSLGDQVFNMFLWVLAGVVLYRYGPRGWRRWQEHRRIKRIERMWKPYFPTQRPPASPVPLARNFSSVPRIAFDWEVQTTFHEDGTRMSPEERAVAVATLGPPDGPRLIHPKPGPFVVDLDGAELNAVQEFFPGIGLKPGRYVLMEEAE